MSNPPLPKDVIGPIALLKEWIAGWAFLVFLKWSTPYTFNAGMESLKSPLRMPDKCEECGQYPADPPSRLCPGCEAYQEHQR
jgi:hypothetical protein